MATGSMSFGPYKSQPQAALCLGRFASGVVGTGTGVIWCEAESAVLLQAPSYDDDGFGLTLIARSLGPVKPAPAESAPSGTWARVEQLVESVMTRIGEAQLEEAAADQAMGQAELAMARAGWQDVKSGWNQINAFIEDHKIAADSVAVGFDAVGVLAGIVSLGVIIAGSVTILPVLGLVAGAASLAMLAADGKMLSFEISGDQAGIESLKDQSWYRWTEAVGPILLLPDLIANGPGAIRELRALPDEVSTLRASEGAARDAATTARGEADAFRDSRPMREDKDWARRKLQRLRTRANKLARALTTAQARLDEAQSKLRTLRTIEVPAYAGSIYTHTMYTFDPPDLLKQHFAPDEQHGTTSDAAPDDPRHRPWLYLLPADSAQSTVPYRLDLHVGVSCRPEPAQR